MWSKVRLCGVGVIGECNLDADLCAQEQIFFVYILFPLLSFASGIFFMFVF